MDVRAIDAGDWAALKALRLRALAEDRTAFGSTLERERAFDEAEWRQRAAGSGTKTTLLARRGDADVGLVTAMRRDDGPSELFGRWVAPEARGSGAGAALLDAALAWLRERGAREAVLWVAEAREPARRIYARAGFKATGRREEMRAHPGSLAIEMTRGL